MELDPWKLADELLSLMKTITELNVAQKSLELMSQAWRTSIREERRAQDRHNAVQSTLAEAFGTLFGWRRSPSSFSLACLARGGHHDGSYHVISSTLLDHPFYYRFPTRNAAAIAAHLYGWPRVEAECRQLAERERCAIRAVTDFPSWWYPGSTTLVLWTALPSSFAS